MITLQSNQTWGYINGTKVRLELASIGGGKQLRTDAAAAFIRMREAARVAGVDLHVNSAFRSWAKQAELYALFQAGGNLAAEPGYSNHQGGVAVDIESANGTNAAYHWLVANAARFGFRRTVASEPWHWEYA